MKRSSTSLAARKAETKSTTMRNDRRPPEWLKLTKNDQMPSV